MTADESRLSDALDRVDALLPGLVEGDLDDALVAATLQRISDEPAMAPRVANEPPPRIPRRWGYIAAAVLLLGLVGLWRSTSDNPTRLAQLSPAAESGPQGIEASPASEASQQERIHQAIQGKIQAERAEIEERLQSAGAESAAESASAYADRSSSSQPRTLVPVRPLDSGSRRLNKRPNHRSVHRPKAGGTYRSPLGDAPIASLNGGAVAAEADPPPLVAERLRERRTYTTPAPPPPPDDYAPTGESYRAEAPSRWNAVSQKPLSTLSIDVDTASYTNVRRFLREGRLPPPDAVRIEELLNWFDYDDVAPKLEENPPFSVTAEVATAPWNADHLLLRVALRAATIPADQVPPRNLVFLVDVSGSMKSAAKLPLLQRAMTLLAANLRPEDTLAIVTYAGRSAVALKPTSGADVSAILAAIDALSAGGSTNGSGGIQTAYDLARRNFDRRGINRVILATDGDFNVGISDRGSLIDLIEKERRSGVFLTALGFGTGNLKDDTLEALADHGNGNYAYIDGLEEAHKVLTAEGGGKLVTVAKDVKLQVEFNPGHVEGWRLLGYENRVMTAREFRDDAKDAGELQAGDGVTALFELVPVGGALPDTTLRYQQAPRTLTDAARSGELGVVNTRWKQPLGHRAEEASFVVDDKRRSLRRATDDFQISAAVAGWGMLLRRDPEVGRWSYADAEGLAKDGQGSDPKGQRRELIELIHRSRGLQRR
jgi:Ca-activated chloride channel homolog